MPRYSDQRFSLDSSGAPGVRHRSGFGPWRDFVASALESDPDYLVVGFASDGTSAVAECQRCDIVFFTQHTSMDYVQAAFELGARGFIDKREGRELLDAIKTVTQGKRFLSEGLREADGDHSDED